ncbi:ParB/RepB/Spo0J family partition protein [Rhodococcus sp. NM-2]|uniref:ParB/RepB/Spo0J family partition protein n=1 Tax=Rhodococcus sp. NM-2 TaxID=3401174 RepID=UPI003AAB86BA
MTATVTNLRTTTNAAEELVHLHPDEIVLEPNARTTVDPDELAELTESLREHGVLLAIKAIRYADGTIRVRDGQRRTLAARDAGLASIPAHVTPDTAHSDKERGIQRIGQQIAANDHRTDLTAGQRAAGIAEMLDLGASITKVAKAVQLPRDQVEALAAVGVSRTACERLDSQQLSLEHAEVVAEFDAAGDDEAVAELLSRHCWNYRYTAERLRRDRAQRAARAEAALPFAEWGYTILDAQPKPTDHITLANLRTSDGEPVTAEHTTEHPELWGVWLEENETHDRNHGDDDTAETSPEWAPEYVLLDPSTLDQNGFELAPEDAAAQDAERQERRRVRELNKLAEAATTVRRDFLRTTLLARKTPPKNAAAWVAATLATDMQLLGEYRTDEQVRDLLGITGYDTGKEVADMTDKASEARAHVLTSALVVAAMEGRMVKDGWRHRPRGAAAYLEMLAANGHELTDVEQAIAGRLDPNTIEFD